VEYQKLLLEELSHELLTTLPGYTMPIKTQYQYIYIKKIDIYIWS